MKTAITSMRRVTLPMACLLCLAAFGAAAGAEGTNGSSDAARIVARQDFDASPDQVPPEIMGRRFWNMMPKHWRNKSDPKPLPTNKWLPPTSQIANSSEPMVREAAVWYFENALVPATNKWYHKNASEADDNNPLVISADRLNEVEFDPKVPFFLGRTHVLFRFMNDYKVDSGEYKRWKEKHPNFQGFVAGMEFDLHHVEFMNKSRPDMDKTINVLRKKWSSSETAIARATNVIMNAVKGRDQALEGLYASYQAAKHYHFDDPGKMVLMHSAWGVDHYPLEWGAGMVMFETTCTGPYRFQVGIPFARGAARQYGKPWAWYIAMCYNGFTEEGKWDTDATPYCLTTNSFIPGSYKNAMGPTWGISVSLNRRTMYLAYLSGSSFVHHEVWPYAYWKFKNDDRKSGVELSPYGAAMKEWYAFTQWFPDRGVSYAPVALMIPFNQGYPQWGMNSWSFFPMERPDSMIDAFTYTLVPSSQYLLQGKEGCLANTPYGDIYDVLLPDQPGGPIPLPVVMNYKVAVMLGGLNPDKALATRLMEYVEKGGTLVVNARQVNNHFPEGFTGARRTGTNCPVEGEVTVAGTKDSAMLGEPYDYEQIELKGARPLWLDGKGGILASVNEYGQGRVILTAADYMVPRKSFCDGNVDTYIKSMKDRKHPLVELLMRQIVRETLPVEVNGDIEYGLNKVADGWWVYLINNNGVTKFTRTFEKLDPAATARVTVDMRALAPAKVQELREGVDMAWDKKKNSFSLDVGPGDIKVVKITVQDASGRP